MLEPPLSVEVKGIWARFCSFWVIRPVEVAVGEVKFSVHQTVSFFFLANAPARTPRRHVLMSVLTKMITREAEKLYSSSNILSVWGDIRIPLGCGFQIFLVVLF